MFSSYFIVQHISYFILSNTHYSYRIYDVRNRYWLMVSNNLREHRRLQFSIKNIRKLADYKIRRCVWNI